MEKCGRPTVSARHHLLFTLDKTFSDLVCGVQFNGCGEFGEALALYQGMSEKCLATNVRRCVLRDPDSSKFWCSEFKSKLLGVCPCQCILIFMLQADTS